MAIKELDAGQRHTFAPSALRVQLTGPVHGGGVQLRALDQAGSESITVRLSDVEVVLTPQPRRLRLVAVPSDGGSFPAGTSIGLTLRTEGASAAAEQILVSPFDAGALNTFEIAVLEFASDRAVLTVSGSGHERPIADPLLRQEFTSGSVFQGSPQTPSGIEPELHDDAEHVWLQPGRYALRDAAKLGESDAPAKAWGVVLDGSGSMRHLFDNGQLDALLGLVCGTYVHWTKRWASASVVAGVRVEEAVSADTDPARLTRTACVDREPSSGSRIAEATQLVVERVGATGAVLIVTDGVPGDIDRVADLALAHPRVRLTIITTGVSRHGLSSDGSRAWWQEELAGLEPIDAVSNISAVALRLTHDGRLELSGARAAEVALRITAPLAEKATA